MNVSLAAGYSPHPKQLEFHRSGARFLCAAAGVRGGKTKAAAVEFYKRIYRDYAAGKGETVSGTGRRRRPRLHYWVVAPTFALIKEPLRYSFETVPPQLIEHFYESDNSLWLKPDILVEFRTADNPLNLVASGLHGMWCDEAARIKPDAWRGQLRQRLSDKNGWALFSTTPLGKNWLYDDIVSRSGQDDTAAVQWTTADNSYIPNLEAELENARRTLPDRYYRREYLASFDAFTGTVFDEWDESIHVVTEADFCRQHNVTPDRIRTVFRRVIATMDFGWNAAGCLYIIGDMGWTHGMVVLEEVYAPNKIVFDPRLDNTWAAEAKRLRDKWGYTLLFADPSRPDAIFDLQRSGLPVEGADNEIVFGIRKLSELMHPVNGKARFRVFDRCTNLRREIPLYQWDQNRAKDGFTDMPAPNQSDHAIDCARYGAVEVARYEPANSQQVRQQGYRGQVSRGPIG